MYFNGYFQGNAGDSLAFHNGMKFTTKDSDNDAGTGNCAQAQSGAWWYNGCHHSNLNGLYLNKGVDSANGIDWLYWKMNHQSMKKCEMKVRPADY